MAMSKKDYEAVARIFRESFATTEGAAHAAITTVMTNFAIMAADENPRFNAKRFYEASHASAQCQCVGINEAPGCNHEGQK